MNSPSPVSCPTGFVRRQLVRWTSSGACGFVSGAAALTLVSVAMGLAGPWIAYLVLLLMAPPCARVLIAENEPEPQGALRRTAGIWTMVPAHLFVQLGALGALHPWWLVDWVVTGSVSAPLYWWGSRAGPAPSPCPPGRPNAAAAPGTHRDPGTENPGRRTPRLSSRAFP